MPISPLPLQKQKERQRRLKRSSVLHFLTLGIVFFLVSLSAAQETGESEQNLSVAEEPVPGPSPFTPVELRTNRYSLCRNREGGGRIRSAQVAWRGDTCNVIYTVHGQDKRVAWGKWKDYCERVYQKILSNLEEDWNCKDVSGQVVFLNEESQ